MNEQNSKRLTKDGFWNLIAESRKECGQDDGRVLQWMKGRLKELGPQAAQDFHDTVHAYSQLANKYGLWSAAGVVGHATDDGFADFRSWLISQGKNAYFAALKDPDTLADLDVGDGGWFESFLYVGSYALQEMTGKDAYHGMDESIYNKLVEELERDIEYGEGINYPFEWDEIPDYFPRLYDKYVDPGLRLYLALNREPSWNYSNLAVQQAREAGPPPRPGQEDGIKMDI